jgi:hypothetical protein
VCAESWQHGWRHTHTSCGRLPSADLISYPQPHHICCVCLASIHHVHIHVPFSSPLQASEDSAGLGPIPLQQLASAVSCCFILMAPVPLLRLKVAVSFDPIRHIGYCARRPQKVTDSAEQSHLKVKKSYSAGQEIPSILRNLERFITVFTRARLWSLP